MSDSHSTSKLDDCRLITLDTNHHENGNLSVVENAGEFAFTVKRVYYIYDVPGGAERGGHSHYRCHRFIVAVSGSFDVVIDDGVERRTVTLNRSNVGLHVVPGVWIELNNFSSGSVCLSLASELYDADDYVRDYQKFLLLTKNKRQ
ncbi:MAG: FdtA/QdtA family cupin domain-containing protein [Bacteroidales bacterium]|nr:FdtA/QdtA family cupin domain-containing protein [Bacteroidales bacterium]MDY4941706.1 FdtA/QdtA family cupin domain-containing protein [Candidatus Limisoma sp.]